MSISVVSLSQRVRWLRKQRGFTLAQVAERSGISLSHLSDIERGRTMPSLETLEDIASVFGLTIGEALVDVQIRSDDD